MRDLEVAIAGFGGAGMAQYGHFRAIPGCRVRAIYDPKPAGLERARQAGAGGLLTDDFEAFLGAGIDLLAVCSPNPAHAEQIVRALRAGIHVICEKPLASSLEECGRILEAERASPSAILGVMHQMRFLPLYGRIREVVARGDLGTISYLEGYYVHNVIRRVSAHDTWVFDTAPPPLLLSGCHFVDLARWLLDDEVEEVVGMGNHLAFPEYPESDLSVVLLRFRSGPIAKVVTAFGAGRPQDHSVRILGTERCIDNNLLLEKDGAVRSLTRPLWRHRLGERRSLRGRLGDVRRDLRHLKAMAAHGAFAALRRLYGRSESYGIASYPLRLYEHALAVRRCLSEFVDCVRTRRRPRSTGIDAAKTVATCLAGVEAYRTGETVPLARYWRPEFDGG